MAPGARCDTCLGVEPGARCDTCLGVEPGTRCDTCLGRGDDGFRLFSGFICSLIVTPHRLLHSSGAMRRRNAVRSDRHFISVVLVLTIALQFEVV